MDQNFLGKGATLSQAWRARQLEYTWLRSLMGHNEDSWQVTESRLGFAPDATVRPPADLPEVKRA